MKQLNKLFTFLSLFSLVAVASCGNQNTSSVVSQDSTNTETSGEEPWQGNWEKEGSFADLSEQEKVDERVCPTCGKSLVDDGQGEKCFDPNGRTLYTFDAIDSHVIKEGGVVIEGDHIGNINQNSNTHIEYHIHAEEDVTVCFGASISEMSDFSYFTQETPVSVNGEPFYSPNYLEPGDTNWTVFKTCWLGCLNLHKGDNKIIMTNPNTGGTQYNFKGFLFLSNVVLSWTEKVDVRVCPTCGKSLVDDGQGEKCFDPNGRTLYTFDAIDSHVIKEGGVVIEGDHIGHINQNSNTHIEYHIHAEEDVTVCFGASISEMSDFSYFTQETPVSVNGEPFYSPNYLEPGDTNWTVFKTCWLGCLNLYKGDNEIIMTNPNTGGIQYNFKSFLFLSDVVLSWTETV